MYLTDKSDIQFLTFLPFCLSSDFLIKTIEMEANFKATADKVRTMKTPSDSDSLELYSLYKQATTGDCNTAKPGMTDIKGQHKWDAWNGKKGMSKDKAMETYVSKATALGV